MKDITYKILDSISQIEKQGWDSVFGDIPEGYQFYKTVEESGLKEFDFYYLALYQEGRIISIAPLFVTDFNLDIAAEGLIEKIMQGLRRSVSPRFLIFKTLFCGSPFGENGILGFADGVNRADVLSEMVKIILEFCRAKGIPMIIFKDFLKGEASLPRSLSAQGFLEVKSFPSVITDLDFSSFDEYLRSLSNSTRKGLRKNIKRAYALADIDVKVTDDIDAVAQEIFRLYENTYNNGTTKFERLTKEFFIKAAKNMPGQAKFFLYYVNGKLGAFNLCFVYKDLLIDKFIGFDYDISRRHSLYFVSWCFNIEWCLKNSIRYYQTGQTDYHPKLRLGGRLVPLYVYLRHGNPLLNSILRMLAVFLKPENFDLDIKGAP